MIRYKRGTNKPFIGSRSGFASEKQTMLAMLKSQMITGGFPVKGDLHIQFTFYFNNYLTKKGVRNRKIPDLSNLYHFPEDCLQDAGIIENDSYVCSHDGSRRLPSPDALNMIEISIWQFSDAKQ